MPVLSSFRDVEFDVTRLQFAPLPPRVFRDISGGATAPAVQYYQRVWSTGTAEWCYYVQPAINPAPTPAETTPNWVGAAIEHNVIAIL